MSHIDDLIDQFCPNGVPFERLGDIANFRYGFTASAQESGDYRFLRITDINQRGNLSLDGVKYVEASDEALDYVVKPGDLLMARTGATYGKTMLVISDEPAVYASFLIRIRFTKPVMLPAYYWHFAQSSLYWDQANALVSTGGQPQFNANVLKLVKVPVPPVEVQREIVRVLDPFSSLEAELEAELQARRVQYAYYRNTLLTFKEGNAVRTLPMRELTQSIAAGRNKSRSTQGEYPVYGSTGLLGYSDQPAYSGDMLLVARVGAYAGLVNAVRGDFDVSDNTLVVRPNVDWDVRFAFYQLSHMNLNQYAVGGGQPLVTGGLLKGLEVAVPPLEEQRRIAAILDKFDALVNDLSIGLPAELNARRKQYQYYRDRLLTFKELAA